MSSPLDWLAAELADLQTAGLFRTRRQVTPLSDCWCLLNGRKVLNFAANDYLGLAHDRRVIAAAQSALGDAGAGAGASALVSGRSDWHVTLEDRLARFEQQPAAILFPTGYAANVGTITALVGDGDTVFCDRLNHASLVDGCRLSGARLRVYRHDDLAGLENELQKSEQQGRRLIVTDGVFSMDGDLAPLPSLCELAERYGAMLLVDEAHGTGVFGAHGRGVCELHGVEDRVTVRVGTLSKGVGALGGFVAGPQLLIDWLWNRARPQIYSTALPPAVCAAATTAIDLIEREPERRSELMLRSTELRHGLLDAGIETIRHACGPIVPVILQSPERAMEVAASLEERGFLVGAIRPPTVPRGTSRLRITVCSRHTSRDIGKLIAALRSISN